MASENFQPFVNQLEPDAAKGLPTSDISLKDPRGKIKD